MQGRRFQKGSAAAEESTEAQGTGNLEAAQEKKFVWRRSFRRAVSILGILDLDVPFFFPLQFPRAVYGLEVHHDNEEKKRYAGLASLLRGVPTLAPKTESDSDPLCPLTWMTPSENATGMVA